MHTVNQIELIFSSCIRGYHVLKTKNLKGSRDRLHILKVRKQAKLAINELTRVIQRQVYPYFWLDIQLGSYKFAKSRDKLVSKSLLSIHLQLVWLVSLLFIYVIDPYFLFKFLIFYYSSLLTFYSYIAIITIIGAQKTDQY